MNDPAMGAGIWLGAVLHRLRHAAGNRAPQLSDAAAMTKREQMLTLCILILLVAGTYTWASLISCTLR